MRLPAACTVALVSLVAWAPAAAQSTPAQPDTVVTSGVGLIQAAPDRAWVMVSAETKGANAREAQRRNTEAMRPVQDALRNARIPTDAIRTVSYDLQQEFDFVNNRRVSRGYVARNAIEVRVDDVTRVGEILELVVGQGATNLGGLRFDLKDRAKLERDALRQAVTDARAKAEAAATGAGRTFDRVLKVEEAGVAMPQPMPMYRGAAMAAEAADVPVATGQIEIRAQVTVTSAMK